MWFVDGAHESLKVASDFVVLTWLRVVAGLRGRVSGVHVEALKVAPGF